MMGELVLWATLLVLMTYCNGFSSSTEEMTTEVTNASQILQDLELYLQQKIEKFKLDLHKTYESSRLRQKRDTGRMTTLPDHNALFEVKVKIQSAESDISQSISQYPLTCWSSVQVLTNHLVLLGTSIGELVLLSFHGNQFSLLFHLKTDVAYKLKHFVYRDEVWFVAIHHGAFEKHYIQLYVFDGNTLFKKQAIHLDGELDIEVSHNRGTFYMGVVSKRNLANNAYHAEFLLYNWRHTQFDMLAKTNSPGAQSVVMWDVEGTMYIAVAQALSQGNVVGSPVFVYHERDDDKLTYIQVIRANQPRKVLHFTVHENHYLLFLSAQGVTIHWWAGDQFLQWFVLEGSENAEDAAILQLPNGEVAIAVAYKHSIHFYMEDFTSKYVMVYRLDLLQEHRVAGISFFYRTDTYYYLVAMVKEGFTLMMPNMWRLNLTSHMTRSDTKWDPLVTCLVALNDTLNTKRKDLDYVGSQVDRVWVTNREQTVTADVVVHGSVKANKELALQDVHIVTDDPEIPHATNGQVREAILDMRSGLEGLKADLNGVVFKNRDQTIHGPLTFTKPLVIGDGVMGNVARDLIINDVPVSALRDLALKVDGEQVVTGDFVVPDVLVHELEVEGHVNHIKPSDMLLLHGDQIVTGMLRFTGAVVQDLIINRGGTLNGLNPASFVTTNTPQVISGVKTFRNLHANKNIQVRGMTNNQDLSDVAKKAILTTGERPISDNVEFTGPVIIRGNLVIRGRINGAINLTALAKDTVDINSEQFIGGQKVFKSPVHVRGDVSVNGKTNGINIPEEIFTLNTEQYIPGNVSFLDGVLFMEDLAVGSINGLPRLAEEAVLKNAPDQIVFAPKTFLESLTVQGDVNTSPHSTINGIDLSDLVLGASRAENFTLYGQTIFQDLTIDGPVIARGTFNGISLADFDALLWRKSLDQVIHGPVTFLGQVVFENDIEVEAGINGLNLDTDLVHTFQDEEILGVKSFAEDLHVEASLKMAPGVLINGFDLPEMSRTVVRSDGYPQVVYGRKMFPRLEVLGDVYIRGTVNGLDLSEELMLTDKEQLVKGHITIMSGNTPIKGSLHAERINVEHDVNGVDFLDFAQQAVMADYQGHLPIKNKNFIGGLKAGNIWAGSVNYVDVNHLFHKAVRIDTPQVLEVSKNFTDLEFIGFQVGTLNGLDLHQFLDRVVLVGDSIIFGPKTVAGSLKVNGDLNTFGLINDVNVQEMAKWALYRDADNVITAPMSFAQGLDIEKVYLGDNSAVDGVLWSDLVFLDREEFLPRNTHFQDDVVVEGNIAVAGLIDGCDLTNLANSALYRDKAHQTLNGIKTIENLVVHGNIEVDGPVNGLDLNHLASSILRKTSDQSVTGTVRFNSQVNVKHLQLANINGNDIDHLFQDAVLKSRPQEIRGHKTLTHPEGIIFGSDLTVDGDLDVKGNINDIDVSYLRDTTVYKTGDQVIFGHKIFQDLETPKGIRVAGLVNGVKIPEDLVLVHGDDVITGGTTFSSPIEIRGNLLLSGAVNGIVLDKLLNDRVTLHGTDVVFSNLTFLPPVECGSLEIRRSINGIPMASLVTRSGSHIIGGNKKFLGDVSIDGDLATLLVNNQDLRELDANTVRHNRDEIIKGLTVFRDTVQMDGDVNVLGTVNDMNVATMPKNLQNLKEETNRVMEDLKSHTEMQNSQLRTQFEAHTYQFSEFAYFELLQVLPARMTQLFSSVTYGFSRPSYVAKPASHLFGWTADGCSRLECCSQNTFIFRVESDGQLSFESGPHHKRLFAFVFSNSTFFTPGFLNGFLLWTNTSSRAINCGIVGPEETVIVSLHGTGLSPLESKQAMTNFQADYSPYVEDAKVVEIDNNIYMLVAYSYSKKDASSGPTIVYHYDKQANMWSHHQTLITHGATRLAISQILLLNHAVTFLAISGRPVEGNYTANPYTSIYRWDANTNKFLSVKEIPSSWPSSILWVDSDADLYLFIANEKSPLHQYYHEEHLHFEYDSFVDPVSVYKYNSAIDDFVMMQNLGLKGVVSMTAYKLAGEMFVAVASRAEDSVFILQLRGYSGFSVIQRIPAHHVQDIHAYWSKDYLFHLAITSDSQTMILRALIRGSSLLPVEGRPLFVDYKDLTSPGHFVLRTP